MDSIPLVSVIIPVFNTASYLKDSIGSILSQSLQDIEIIVINDASTDESETIINEMRCHDKRISYYKLITNRGQSIARNKGIDLAKGKYIYFMDSDDILRTDALERCYHYCENYALDFLFFDGELFCETDISPHSWDYQRTNIYNEEKVYNGLEIFNNMLDRKLHRAAPWLMFISHTHLKKLNITFYPSIIHEDELFTPLLYMQSTRIGCLKQTFVKHRVRNNSTMTIRYSLRNIECYLTVFDQLFLFAHQHKEFYVIIEKFARYTLNPVFQTAKILPYKDKWNAFCLCSKKNYLHYLSIKTLLIFLFK